MNFDEQSNSEFPVALNVRPADSTGPKPVLTARLRPLDESTSARMDAPWPAKTKINPAVMVFRRHRTQTLVARSAVPLPVSITIH